MVQPVRIKLTDFVVDESSTDLNRMLRSKLMVNTQQRLTDFLFRLLSTEYALPPLLDTPLRSYDKDSELEKASLPCCKLSEEEIMEICSLTSSYYDNIPNIIKLNSPLSICGTIKGSFSSLDTILDECKILNREKQTLNYQCNGLLFLGGFSLTPFLTTPYVLRRFSYFAVEVVLTLYCLKLLMPEKVHLLRGSVENRWVDFGNLHDVCLERFGNKSGKRIYDTISNVFLDLPLVAIVDDQVMCVNSGIPFIGGLKELQAEERRIGLQSAEYDSTVLACTMHEAEDVEGWKMKPLANELLFGPDITKRFLEEENLKLLISGKLLCDCTCSTHDGLVLMVSSFATHGQRNGGIINLKRNCKYTVTSFE